MFQIVLRVGGRFTTRMIYHRMIYHSDDLPPKLYYKEILMEELSSYPLLLLNKKLQCVIQDFGFGRGEAKIWGGINFFIIFFAFSIPSTNAFYW